MKLDLDKLNRVKKLASTPKVVDILEDSDEAKEALVVVPDDQLSLAIGIGGQNVRLAHRLTGWKIDIKSLSQVEESGYYEQDVQEDIQETEGNRTGQKNAEQCPRKTVGR